MKEDEKPSFIHDINSIALVETSRIKLLKDGVYKSVSIDGLPLVPIYINTITEEGYYELEYKLVVLSIKIPSAYCEIYTKALEFEPVPNIFYGEPIIYDNENIETIDRLPNSYEAMISYVSSHKRKIFEFAGIVNDHIHDSKKLVKSLKKVPK